jgi:PAS domain S-box-containing protein
VAASLRAIKLQDDRSVPGGATPANASLIAGLDEIAKGKHMHPKKTDQLNILMVDDQPQKLLAYEAMLAGLGERLLRAQNGNQAFEVLLHEEVAVILLDVQMPGMDGFETAALIREHPRFTKTPIIFVTAVNTSDLDRIRGYEIGAVDYVSVPVIPEILRAKVSVFVELHRKTRELEQVNASLSESEQRMRAILDTANDAIITIDAGGTMQRVNPAAENIFGYAMAEMIGQNVGMLLPASLRDEYARLISQPRGTERRRFGGSSREIQGLRKDGLVVPLEVAVSELVPGNMFTGIIRDISRRKELEREVTEVAAAEQRRIGQELHDGVSQELTGLSMLAAALQERLHGTAPATETLANRVLEGLANVQKHVRAVSHGLIPVDVDAEGLRAALEDLSGRVHQQTGVACAFHSPRSVLVKDSLTATHLYHIVQEAVNNALRHGRAGRIDIHLRARPESLILTVSDDGVGIAADANRRDGVGLRLMRYRAGLIGGVLQIRPGQDQGTQVTCTLSEWRPRRARSDVGGGPDNNKHTGIPA